MAKPIANIIIEITLWAKYLELAAGSVNRTKINNDPTIWAATLTLNANNTKKTIEIRAA